MARRQRCWVPNAPSHTISRFVDRRFYLATHADRRALQDAIAIANKRWDWTWLSYAFMSSHLHHGHLAGHVDPDRFFRSVHTRFAMHFHRRRGGATLGPVFAHRPVIHPVRSTRLLRLVAYHHRNPVEAGVVQRARDSTWTSHRAYLRLEPAPPFLDVERALEIVGFDDTAAGRRQFDEFVMDAQLDDWVDHPADEDSLHAVTRAGVAQAPWEGLIRHARIVSQLPASVSIRSRRRAAVQTRILIATVASEDFGQTYAAIAEHIGMRPGSVFNLLARTRVRDLDALNELRARLAA